ncbi:MAG: AtpZ/AtpI family protein [Candidatus Eremiobacteraeota bacterium]|nr:AtpZ/AtpI family protein [Candidatus Eremiobacteraeota bacterium]
MRAVAPVLAAGATFAVTTLAGLFAGLWLGDRMRAPIFAAAGLFVGLALGGYSAYRLLMRSI